ncbi:MAG: KTSC domain-containing protein [Actinomycetota bacterium]|jgi:hypothetical protein|nr:KTSC domain-containing protein [Actinomycetota bacterium]
MLPVDSSSIERIGYVGYDRELYIEFRNGRLYVYEGVPAWVHVELLQAGSRGSYLNTEIKPNHAYRHVT